MRRVAAILAGLGLCISISAVRAEDGKVCKVLPQFLDVQNRSTLSPSLYERDAYQFYLRRHPKERAALRLAVQWKSKDVDWHKLTLRAELRGLETNSMQTITQTQAVKKTGWFSSWTDFDIKGGQYRQFGELIAWRVTLWDGDRQLSELQSAMWSGVPEH